MIVQGFAQKNKVVQPYYNPTQRDTAFQKDTASLRIQRLQKDSVALKASGLQKDSAQKAQGLPKDSTLKKNTGLPKTALLSKPPPPENKYLLLLLSTDNEDFLKKINYKTKFPSRAERNAELQNVLLILYSNGNLAATYDSIVNDSLKMTASLHIGPHYIWAHLQKGNVEEAALTEAGFREKIYFGKNINYKEVRTLLEKIIGFYENNGYPFTAVRLDSVTISETIFNARLHVDKNKLVKIDSIIIRNNVLPGTKSKSGSDQIVAPVYVENYIGIRPGDLYNESHIRLISPRLKELPFLREKRPFRILFTEKETKLILELEKKNASQFDGIIGFLPDPVTGKLLVTGDVNLKLQNKFGRGELIDLSWSSLKPQTQDLKLELMYPFLLSSPFGIDYTLQLYKLDTTYIDVSNTIGVQYLLTGGNYLKVFYTNKNSRLLSTDGLEFITTLPEYADVSTNSYGIGLKQEHFDYKYNPRKGYSLIANTSIGSKVISQNPNLNPVVYQGLTLNSVQYAGDITGALYFPIVGKNVIKIGVKSAFVAGPSLFQNEAFRIGGLNTLRGFDEQSIYATRYAIGTIEYRFLLEQNSFLHLFFDQAYYENTSLTRDPNAPEHDIPFGFGTGISFETKAGIFSLDYALGYQTGSPIYLKDGKIHFGIVNYF